MERTGMCVTFLMVRKGAGDQMKKNGRKLFSVKKRGQGPFSTKRRGSFSTENEGEDDFFKQSFFMG